MKVHNKRFAEVLGTLCLQPATQWLKACVESKDYVGGGHAFLEKRKPKYVSA